MQGVDLMAVPGIKFHGFESPLEALNHYYKHQLNGRHTDCFEFRQERALLEWLYEIDLKEDGNV